MSCCHSDWRPAFWRPEKTPLTRAPPAPTFQTNGGSAVRVMPDEIGTDRHDPFVSAAERLGLEAMWGAARLPPRPRQTGAFGGSGQ